MQKRIGTVIRAYEEQGFHRTGTTVDQISGNWLANEIRQIGLEPIFEEFSLSQVEPVDAFLEANNRRIEGLPLFDGTFTNSTGIAGTLGALDIAWPAVDNFLDCNHRPRIRPRPRKAIHRDLARILRCNFAHKP